jgi:hypothetical protein
VTASADRKPKSARQRIVISLEQGRQTPRLVKQAARWPKVLAALGTMVLGIVLLATAGLYLLWQHYKTTPTYSLAMLVDAAQRDDMALIDNLVDTDKIAEGIASQVADKAARRYGVTLDNSVRRQIDAAVPSQLPSLKESIRVAITDQVKEISKSAEHRPFIVTAVTLPYFVSISRDGDFARVTATVRDRATELGMQRYGDSWKVSEFRDEALLERAVDNMIKELPPIGQNSGSKLSKRLKTLEGDLMRTPQKGAPGREPEIEQR